MSGKRGRNLDRPGASQPSAETAWWSRAVCSSASTPASSEAASSAAVLDRSRLYRTAREAVERSLAYAFVGRKQRKREFRKLWILRINAGARENGLSYSKLMFGLAQAGVALNRKVLADLAVRQKEDFAQLVELAKTKLA